MKISIIIPVYNAEKYLKQCLDSFLNQTFKNIEIICVDDGSIDNSFNILKEYQYKYKNIHVFHQKNQGAGAARNFGLNSASGDYVYFFDADDYAKLELCEEINNIVEYNGKIDIIRFKAKIFDSETGNYIKNDYVEMENFPKSIFNKIIKINDIISVNKELPCPPWLGFYRKDFLIQNNINFDNFICANDVGFFYHTLIKAKTIYMINKAFVYYRLSKTNLSSNRDKNFEYEIMAYNRLDEITANSDDEIRRYILKTHLIHILNEYISFLNSKFANDIHNQTKTFLKTINLKKINTLLSLFDRKMFFVYLLILNIKILPFCFVKFLYNIYKNIKFIIRI